MFYFILNIVLLFSSCSITPMGVFPSKKISTKKIKVAFVAASTNKQGDDLCLIAEGNGQSNAPHRALLYNLTTGKIEAEQTTKDHVLYAALTDQGPMLITSRSVDAIERAFTYNITTQKESLIVNQDMRSWHTYKTPYGAVLGKNGTNKALVILDKKLAQHKTIICDNNNKITGTITHKTKPTVNMAPDEKKIVLYHQLTSKAYITLHDTAGKEILRFNVKKYGTVRPWFHPFKNLITVIRDLYCAQTGKLKYKLFENQKTIVADFSQEDRMLSHDQQDEKIQVNRFYGPHIPLFLEIPSGDVWGYPLFTHDSQQALVCWYNKATGESTAIHVFGLPLLIHTILDKKYQ